MEASLATAKARRYQLKEDIKFRWYIADLNSAKLKFNVPINTKENFIFWFRDGTFTYGYSRSI